MCAWFCFLPARGCAEHRHQPGRGAQTRLPAGPQRQGHERGRQGRGGDEHPRDFPWNLQKSLT